MRELHVLEKTMSNNCSIIHAGILRCADEAGKWSGAVIWHAAQLTALEQGLNQAADILSEAGRMAKREQRRAKAGASAMNSPI